jgi:cytoplasmic iron level regulating protein YaaA (DUF328/UPF0246 family)
MLILLSPAKTLADDPRPVASTQPRMLAQTEELVHQLRDYSPEQLGELMSISEKLADLNHERYQTFTTPFTVDNASAALQTFKGDVYQGLEAADFNDRELELANKQIRILSGLYGLLRPSDLMQAYRLEMGTKLATDKGKDLYAFWGDSITDQLNADLAEDKSKLVLNLASQEYFKSLQPERIEGRILNIHFKELRQGKYRVITFNAKKARGKMARLITLEGITTADPLKELVVNDYTYNEDLSTENDWVYVID